MPRLAFTENLKKHLDCPPRAVAGETIQDALQSVFAENPRLQSYIFDDQDRLRKHIAIFVNGSRIDGHGPEGLRRPIGADEEVFVFQALSGG